MFIISKLVKRSLRLCRGMSSVSKLPAHDKGHYYVWVDLEMTGLDVNIHKIVEVACIITSPQLEVLGEGLHTVVHLSKHVFENECNEWSYDHHKKTGLMAQSLESKISIKEADDMVTKHIKQLTNYSSETSGNYYLAGNSVYMDKIFISKYMPELSSLLHYRIIDVSTIKTLCSFWYPSQFKNLPTKKLEHRALSDIKESIEELRWYRQQFFIP